MIFWKIGTPGFEIHVMQPVDYSYYGAESSWGVGKAELVLTEEHGQKAITEFLSGHKINLPYKSVVLFSNSSYLRLLEYQQDTNAILIMIAGHDHFCLRKNFSWK